MAKCEVMLQLDDGTPLANVWAYWLQGDLQVLRTDGNGRVWAAGRSGLGPVMFMISWEEGVSKPWGYNKRFTADVGSQVEIYYSRGQKPIPPARMADEAAVYYSRKVALPSPPATATQPAHVGPNVANALVPTPVAVIKLPPIRLTLTQPLELYLWPLLWELHTDAYYTDGLRQGTNLLSHNVDAQGHVHYQLGEAENTTAAAPAATIRPKGRGLVIKGSIDSRATGVKIRILDKGGNVVKLRQNATATAGLDEIPGSLEAAAGNIKPFSAVLYLQTAPTVFGPIQIWVLSDGMTPPIIDAFAVQLVGLQAALVDDATVDHSGQTPGKIQDETQENIVVDFQNSPQTSRHALEGQARARRMITYQMFNRDRPVSATNGAMVLTPEMPFWMGEFHILGLNQDQLEDLMIWRKHVLNGAPTTLRFDLSWKLTLSWDGPDIGTATNWQNPIDDFSHTETVIFTVNKSAELDGVNAQGEVANAITLAPVALTFPVTGRRLPKVFVKGKSPSPPASSNARRVWGRQAGAASADAVVIEWQPRIVNAAGNEILRGGNGKLEISTVQIDSKRIEGGLLAPTPPATAPAPPPAAAPDLQLPWFRVRGLNPPSPANAIIDTLVQDYYDQHHTAARVTLLTRACWQETIRRILGLEANMQFEAGGSRGSVVLGGHVYGLQQDMPIFGPPHGYGYGQIDNPPVTTDQAWSFKENIKAAVKLVMGDGAFDKAQAAYNMVSPHLPAGGPDQRTRAVYQREIVRRYNGGTEFQWNGTDWEITPTVHQWQNANNHSQGPYGNLRYPNLVLGTTIHYYSGYPAGQGANTTFPWPIPFAAAQYGPGI